MFCSGTSKLDRETFPFRFGLSQSNNTSYKISSIFKYNFCLAPRWKLTWRQLICFFYISPLKSMDLILIIGKKLDGQLGTWTGRMAGSPSCIKRLKSACEKIF